MRLIPHALSSLFAANPDPVPKPKAAGLFDDIAVDKIMAALTRLPDPDAILKQVGYTRADLRKMETDDEISAALDTRRDAVLATPWRLEPVGADAGRGKAGFPEEVEWLWTELEPHVPDLIAAAWNAVPYGYSVAEVIPSPPAAPRPSG